jgi:hypothetical protein
MDDVLEKALARRFHIYKTDEENTLFNMFTFDCGPGWVPLLIEFARAAERLDVCDVLITQIKEKWNTLRIYHSAGGLDQDELNDLALDIEERSAFLCEVCGSAIESNKRCCCHGNSDIDAINERMLMLIEGKPLH